METELTKKENYLAQLDEAIKELNAAFAEYENIEFLINIQKMSDQEKQYFKDTVNKIRVYETHAYIRLKTVEKDFNTKQKELIELRKKLKVPVPDREDVEKIVLMYNRLQLKKLTVEDFFGKI